MSGVLGDIWNEALNLLAGSLAIILALGFIFLVVIPARLTQVSLLKYAPESKPTFLRAVAVNLVGEVLAGVITAFLGMIPILGAGLSILGYFIGGSLGLMLFSSIPFGKAFKCQFYSVATLFSLIVMIALFGSVAVFVIMLQIGGLSYFIGILLILVLLFIIGWICFAPLDKLLNSRATAGRSAVIPPSPLLVAKTMLQVSPLRNESILVYNNRGLDRIPICTLRQGETCELIFAKDDMYFVRLSNGRSGFIAKIDTVEVIPKQKQEMEKVKIRICPNCNEQLPERNNYCPTCGEALKELLIDKNIITTTDISIKSQQRKETSKISTKTCPKCYKLNPEINLYCKRCGEPLNDTLIE